MSGRNWIGHPSLGDLKPGALVELPDGSRGVIESVDPQFDDAVTVRLDSGGLTSREPTAVRPTEEES